MTGPVIGERTNASGKGAWSRVQTGAMLLRCSIYVLTVVWMTLSDWLVLRKRRVTMQQPARRGGATGSFAMDLATPMSCCHSAPGTASHSLSNTRSVRSAITS